MDDLICPQCGKIDKESYCGGGAVKRRGICSTCREKLQPLVQLSDGSFIPFSDYFHDFGDRLVKRDSIRGEDGVTSFPKISFDKIEDKWKIDYVGADCEINDHGAIKLTRYFRTKEDLLKALGI